MTPKQAIAARARALGFDDCRFTSAEPPATSSRFEHWLQRSYHGEMHYLQRNAHKRVNPGEVLNGARTIIVLAASYYLEQRGPADSQNRGGLGQEEVRRAQQSSPSGAIARYAQFADYHDVLGGRLRELAGFVDAIGGEGTRSLWYVDTGPFLERDLAQRAGIGFVGKHTNLISRRLGNWIFLCEIITTLELEPDAQEQNRCGTCTRCLTACPTEAIVAPFQLDARRCISYLTIELKGSIPESLRPAIGNRIYGCDDCLAVCPWNRFAREGKLMQEHARSDLSQPALIELLGIDNDEFKRRFGHTPLARAKRRGLLRNVCVALGNIGDASALPALERAAADPEPLIAEHARWAIGRLPETKNRAESRNVERVLI